MISIQEVHKQKQNDRMLPEQLSWWRLIGEDWRVHGKDWRRPGFKALAVHRFGDWVYALQSPAAQFILRKLYGAMARRLRNHYGIEIDRGAKIGRRLKIAHHMGVVIGHGVEIGDGCLIRHNVTLGAASQGHSKSRPKIGNKVEIGAGAQILGSISIGDGVKIGANAVVTTDIPAHCIVFVDKPKVIRLPGVFQKKVV